MYLWGQFQSMRVLDGLSYKFDKKAGSYSLESVQNIGELIEKANSLTSIQLKIKTTTRNIKSVMKNQKNMQLEAVFQSSQDANRKDLQVFIQNIISVQSEIIKTSNLGQEHQVQIQEPHHLEEEKKITGKKIVNQSIQWTSQQTDTLFYLFQNWGSKWTKISQQMKGRSENCIKNRFYGNLRKVLRRMNKAAKNLVKKFKKQLKFQSITRIIDASQGLFRLKSPLKEESETLTKKIIDLAKKENQQMTPQEAETLIKQINKFNMLTRSYKSQKKISNRKNNKRAEKPNIFNGNNSTNLNEFDQEKMQVSEIEVDDELHPSSTHQDNFMAQQIPRLKKMDEEEVELLNQKEREYLKQNRVRTYPQKYLQQILNSEIYSPLQFEAWI